MTGAIAAARRLNPGITVEVEVESLQELAAALPRGPDIVMLDEFSARGHARRGGDAQRARPRRVKLEASGSVSLELVRGVAATGVDYISVGALTKHIHAVDLSMRLEFSSTGAHG